MDGHILFEYFVLRYVLQNCENLFCLDLIRNCFL